MTMEQGGGKGEGSKDLRNDFMSQRQSGAIIGKMRDTVLKKQYSEIQRMGARGGHRMARIWKFKMG